jgi:integrase
MFSDAVRDELCERNPFLNMRLRQGQGRKDLVVPTPEDIDGSPSRGEGSQGVGRARLRAADPVRRLHGRRPGELFGLDWRHVDRRGRTLRSSGSGTRSCGR